MKLLSSVILFLVLLFVLASKNTYAYTNGMDASLVLGQANFTANTANQGGAVAANTLRQPKGLVVVDNKLIVVDEGNNRVLIYNALPTSHNAAADVVIGQANMSGSLANRGGAAADDTLNQPYDVATDGTKLLISDMGNNRVLIFNTIPTANGASADVVLGQTNFTNTGADTSQTRFTSPMGMAYDLSSGKLVITDNGNSRVLVYNAIPAVDGAAANVVIGHADFDTFFTDTASSTTLFLPYDVIVADSKLLITDTSNSRVLIYNAIPTQNGAAADIVIGQPDMDTTNGGPTATTSDAQNSLYFDGNKLYVGDWDSRVLIYNSIPTSNGAAANVVLGQSSFTSDAVNAGGIGPNTLNSNTLGLVRTGNELFVSDTENNRILRFTDVPEQVQAAPEITLTGGQTEVVVNSQESTIVTIPAEITNATVDVSALTTDNSTTATATLPSISMIATTSLSASPLQVAIPASTILTAPTGWNGTINVPQVVSTTSVIPPSQSGQAASVLAVIEVGYNDIPLSFNKAVRIYIPDQAGKRVGYSRSGIFTEITTVCADDTQAVGNALPADGDCKIDSGGDLVIWTKHFTKFATYQYTSVASLVGTSSSDPSWCDSPAPFSPDLFQINVKANQATLYFTPVNNTTGYYISYGIASQYDQHGVTFAQGPATGVLSYTIYHLQPKTPYYFRIRGQNNCMPGTWSTELKVKSSAKSSKTERKYYKYRI